MTATRSVVLAILCSIVVTGGQALLKMGVLQEDSFLMLLIHPWVILGVSLLVVGGFMMLYALRDGELSVTHPLLSLGFVWILIIGYAIGETVRLTQWAGVGVMLVGVVFITRSRS